MGTVTPNISIYIPSAGETNYDQSFALGMTNIDQHDHTGAPTKGVQIPTGGLADGSVTYPKLNANVADNTTGIGTHTASLSNQLYLLGILANIYQIATTNGFIVKNGSAAAARTLTGTSNQITVTNGDGTSGNPVFSLPSTIYTDISFDGGTTTLDTYKTGTFTPTLAFGGTSTGVTYATNIGKYWQIGSVLYYNIEIILTSKGSDTGVATVEGLPTASALDNFNNIATLQGAINSYTTSGPTVHTYLVGEQNNGNTNITIAACGPAANDALTDANFGDSDAFALSGFYWVA